MTSSVSALSVSRSVVQHLSSPDLRTLAVFEHVINLVAREARRPTEVIALVTPEVGNGPLNVVVEEARWDPAGLEPGTSVQVDGECLSVGGLVIDRGEASVWDPRPNWRAIRASRVDIAAQLPILRDICTGRARTGSFLTLLGQAPQRPPLRSEISVAARAALELVAAAWNDGATGLRDGTSRLAGLGDGLTPSGDDFLCGVTLWAWIAEPRPRSFSRLIADTAGPRTTTLSAALLAAAARGECSASWHALLGALTRGDDADVVRAVRRVLARGANSGADALAGFLWAGTTIGLRD